MNLAKHPMLKNLPIGDQTFVELIKPEVLYVDKTEYIYKLVRPGRGRYFFSRPRRFGKSTSCSTLDAVFRGDKALFKDLWIGSRDYEFVVRPVVRFDFSQISHSTPEKLEFGLLSAVQAQARKHGIILEEKGLSETFAELITKLGQTKAPV